MTSACGPHVRKMRLYKNESLEMLSQQSSVTTATKNFATTLFVLVGRTNAAGTVRQREEDRSELVRQHEVEEALVRTSPEKNKKNIIPPKKKH